MATIRSLRDVGKFLTSSVGRWSAEAIEATVKAFRRDEEKKQIWLLPRNSAYLPIPANDVDILGKVVTVLRSI